MKNRSGYWLFFHIVFAYIVLSFFWWMYLLTKNNRDDYEALVVRERTIFTHNGGTDESFYKSGLYEDLEQDYTQKKWMLLGEAGIFIVLISAGFWRIRMSFRHEILLTRQQNNFLLSITHELKSPLASLKLSMQTLQKRNLDADKIRRLGDMSMDDINRLENLVENILLASKIESSNFKLNRDLINLSEITRNIFETTTEKFREQRIFTSAIEPDVYIHADKLSLMSVIYNLIENAIKYSREGGSINVELRGDEQCAYLKISDTGIGIPENEKSKIFERFYRIGSEDTRTTKGTGLGLFIVKQIVQFHNGKIEVSENQPHGTVFSITIPVS